MEGGMRFNEGKARWGLVPQSALLPMVQVLEFGAKKYAAHNWMKGLSITQICESMKRHLDSFMEHENNDPESGISHIGHIQCNAMFLSWMMENRPDLDDRFNPATTIPTNNPEGVLVCEECGCKKVQSVTWVEVNTGEVFGQANSEGADEQDNWCPDCQQNCSVTSLQIFNEKNQEEE